MAQNRVQFVVTVDDKGTPVIKQFTGNFTDSMRKIEKESQSLSSKIKSNWVAIGAAVGGTYLAVKKGILPLIQLGSDYEQSVFRMRKTFGKEADTMIQLSRDLADTVGFYFGETEIQYAFTKTADSMKRYGIEGQEYINLITTAMDVAASKNLELGESIDRLESAMRGEAEASEYLGVTLGDTYMKNIAFDGSLKDVWESLSDNEKAHYRLQELLKQTGKYSGAASEATNTLAGSMKQLKNMIKDQVGPVMAGLINEYLPTLKESIAGFAMWLDDTFEVSRQAKIRAVTEQMANLDAEIQRLKKGIEGTEIDIFSRSEEIKQVEALTKRYKMLESKRKDLIEQDKKYEIEKSKRVAKLKEGAGGDDKVDPSGKKEVDQTKETQRLKLEAVKAGEDAIYKYRTSQEGIYLAQQIAMHKNSVLVAAENYTNSLKMESANFEARMAVVKGNNELEKEEKMRHVAALRDIELQMMDDLDAAIAKRAEAKRAKEQAEAEELYEQRRTVMQMSLETEKAWNTSREQGWANQLEMKSIQYQHEIDMLKEKGAKEIEIEAATSNMRKQMLTEGAMATADALQSTLQYWGQHNKNVWRMYKAYAIGRALIDTYHATVAAFRAMAGIPPAPLWGILAGGAALAWGLTKVQMIRKQQPQGAAEGGVFSGPATGFPMELHGTEAVVPLPNGKSIPVETRGGGAGGGTMNVNITATDSQSFTDLVARNPQAIIGPLVEQMQLGNRNLISTMQDTTREE